LRGILYLGKKLDMPWRELGIIWRGVEILGGPWRAWRPTEKN